MSRITTLSPIALAFLCGFAASSEGFNGECMVDGLEPDIPDKAKIEDEAAYWLKSEGLLQHLDNAKVLVLAVAGKETK